MLTARLRLLVAPALDASSMSAYSLARWRSAVRS